MKASRGVVRLELAALGCKGSSSEQGLFKPKRKGRSSQCPRRCPWGKKSPFPQSDSRPPRASGGDCPPPCLPSELCWGLLTAEGEQRCGSDSGPRGLPASVAADSPIPVLSPTVPMGERPPEAPLPRPRQVWHVAEGSVFPRRPPYRSDPAGPGPWQPTPLPASLSQSRPGSPGRGSLEGRLPASSPCSDKHSGLWGGQTLPGPLNAAELGPRLVL